MTPPARPLGFWMCTALVIGNIIGMGIFMLPASLAPYGLNAFLGWSITILGCVFIAQLFASFARAMPDEDGPYGYTRRAFGNGAAFFIMWCYWVAIWVSNAALAVGVVGYLLSLFPVFAQEQWMAPALGLGLIWLFVLINLRGAKTSGWVQMVTTLLKLLPMFAVIILGGYVLFSDPHQFAAHLPTTALSFESTAAAGTVALFSMLGVECATIPANKVENAGVTIPRATMAGTLITAAIYIAVSAVPLLLLPQTELAASSAPYVDLFKRFMGGDAGRVLALFVVISGLGCLNGWTLMGGELTASFAHHGVFPAVMMRQNRHGAPAAALVFTGVLASVMVAMNYSRTLAQGFTFLSVVVTAANLPLYLIAGLGLIMLWRRGTLGVRGAWPLFCAIMAIAYSVWAFYGVGRESMLWAIALGAVSLPVFWCSQVWRKAHPLTIGADEVATHT